MAPRKKPFKRPSTLVPKKLQDIEIPAEAEKLGKLRNQHAHARGKDPERDALKAIWFLDTVVQDTVSAFKEFEIKDGALVRKATR